MTPLEALFTLHSDIPREAPGGDAVTLEALRRMPPLPADARVLDVGCGPGRQTLVLAAELQRPIVAVDLHAPYLARLERAAAERGLDRWISTRQQSMAELDDAPGSFDLIWSEGAIYIVGFEEGLRLWRPLLRGPKLVAVTELAWLDDSPPGEVREFWREGYPAMATVDENRRRAERAGFEVFDSFVLPTRCWWDEYLTPLAARAAALRPAAVSDAALAAVLDEAAREEDVVRRFGAHFGYVFFLMRAA